MIQFGASRFPGRALEIAPSSSLGVALVANFPNWRTKPRRINLRADGRPLDSVEARSQRAGSSAELGQQGSVAGRHEDAASADTLLAACPVSALPGD